MNVPSRVLHTMTAKAIERKPPFFVRQTVSVLSDATSLWLPPIVNHEAGNGSYLVQVVGRGQYQCTCDLFHEHYPDAIRHDAPIINDVVPTTSTPLFVTQQKVCNNCHTTPLAPATPAAKSSIPQKPLPAVSSWQCILIEVIRRMLYYCSSALPLNENNWMHHHLHTCFKCLMV